MEYVNQELLRTDHQYPSGTVYPREEVERQLAEGSSFMKRVSRGALRGEVSHPTQQVGETMESFTSRVMTIDERNVSHVIKDVRIDDDGVVRATVIGAGPRAGWLELAANSDLKFGLRAFARLELKDGVQQPQAGSLNIVTFDLLIGNESTDIVVPQIEQVSLLKTREFCSDYLIGLGELGKMAQKVMDEREIVMFYAIKRMAEIPEGPTTSYEVVRSLYSINRLLAASVLKQVELMSASIPEGTSGDKQRSARLRSSLMLVSAQQAIELEHDDKGEIFRMYDQTRRGLIESYNREVEHLKGDFYKLP